MCDNIRENNSTNSIDTKMGQKNEKIPKMKN